jgi:hypothetical protein
MLAEQNVATKPCLAQLTEPGLSADDSIDAYATEKYSAAVSNMLAAEEFKQLDCLADSLRESQVRFASGAWKLHIFYSGLEAPLLHATEKDWKEHLKRLKNWQYENPESITARIALAEADLSYAWDARGNQGAETVSDNGWQLFGQRAAEARKILEKASSLKAKCPEWYVAMETVALAQGWGRPEAQAVVEEAFAKDPQYYHVYPKYALYLLPRWYGEEGETEAFAASIADRLGGDQGDAVYYKIAVSVVCNCKTEPQLERMSWPRIQKGFAALEKQNGVSMANLNTFALMAIKLNDSVVADQMFRRMGDRWNESIWKNRAYFDASKAWAAAVAPTAAWMASSEKEAAANLQAPEGPGYHAAVGKTFHNFMQECVPAASGDGEAFELLVQIGDHGLIQQMMSMTNGSLSNCLFAKFAKFRLSKTTPFPPPPKSPYWMRFDLDPKDYSSTDRPPVSGKAAPQSE